MIKKGSIVDIKDETENIFVVATVFKINVNKWHISENEDNHTCSFLPKEEEKYQFQGREVSISAQAEGWQVIRQKYCGAMEYEFNVQDNYKLVNIYTCVNIN